MTASEPGTTPRGFRWPWQPRPHEHVHRPIRVQHVEQMMLPFSQQQVTATIVLYHCTCGAVQTYTLLGRWTMDDVLGKTPGETADDLLAASRVKP